MQSNCYGDPISLVCVAVLYTTVVMNMFIMFAFLLLDLQDNKLLFGNDFKTKILLILSESILSLFAAVVFIKRYSSAAKMILQYCVFVAVIELLVFDLICTTTIAFDLLFDEGLDRFCKRRGITASSPIAVNVFVIVVLILYFVFKLHTAIIILKFGITSFKTKNANENDTEHTSSEQATVANVELTPLSPLPDRPPRFTFLSPPQRPPPPYFKCVIDMENPPPYSSLL